MMATQESSSVRFGRRMCGQGLVVTVMALLFCLTTCEVTAQLNEHDRIEEYHRRNHSWPPLDTDYVPNTPGWKREMERRFHQAHRQTSRGDRYQSYVNAVSAALTVPNFTESGWGLTKAPQYLIDILRDQLHKGVDDHHKHGGLYNESDSKAIFGPNKPFMVPNNEMNRQALHELLPVHEAWSKVKLKPSMAYGLRVYQDEASLLMHVDKTDTHVISSILHVDHDPDSEPWPIVIQDYHGNLNEVVLESGDMLLYESSKCTHGRPIPFKGSWYSSLFIHYAPSENWNGEQIKLDANYRIPPSWEQDDTLGFEPDDDIPELVMSDTAFYEPSCEHDWCGLNNTIKWSGPGEYGKVLSAGGLIETLDIPPEKLPDTHEEL